MSVQDSASSILGRNIPAGLDNIKSFNSLKIPPRRRCAQVTLKNKARGKRKEQGGREAESKSGSGWSSLFFFLVAQGQVLPLP